MNGINDMYQENYMGASERLTAFLDGELPQEDTGTLFYELANNPELQDEMKELLLIRNTFKNTMITPPEFLKSKVMQRTVFAGNPFGKYIRNASAAIALFYSKTAVSIYSIAFLGILAYYFFGNQSSRYENNITSIPVTESIESNLNGSTNPDIGSLFADNYFNQTPQKTQIVKRSYSAGRITKAINNQTNDVSEIIATQPIVDDITKIEASDFSSSVPFGLGISESEFNYQPGQQLLNNRFLEKFSISLRSFNGSSTPSFDLGKENPSILNNFSIGLNYNIDNHHVIGFVYGMENFLMDFEKYEGDILYSYRQSYNTQWIALYYSYIFNEIGGSGFRPELNLLAGGTNIGPVIKLGGGLSYYLTDYLTLRAGIESGWLIYPNNGLNSGSSWFSTNKIGYNFGVNIGL